MLPRPLVKIPALLALLALAALLAMRPATAGDTVFTVRGVKVDVTDTDAAAAKIKAIRQAQMKAFHILINRISSEDAWVKLSALGPRKIGRMMRSLSIEEERTGARRYIGRLTIRFRPERVRKALNSIGASYVTQQAKRTLIVPLWKAADGSLKLWEDNPWRKAWLELRADDALVPILVPVGDLTDRQTITAEEAMESDPVKLEALQMRYDTDAVLVAIGEEVGENSLRAIMSGKSPVGDIAFDKTYIAPEGGTLEDAAALAVKRFHAVMLYKWKKKLAARRAERAARRAAATRLPVTVHYDSLRQWQMLRSRIMTTPGVTSVDVSTLAGNGAEIILTSRLPLAELQRSLEQSRLYLQNTAGRWVLRAY